MLSPYPPVVATAGVFVRYFKHLLIDGLSMGVDRRPTNAQGQASPISPAPAQILSKRAISDGLKTIRIG